jgi:methylthioribose-1-phosphate isomerase
LKVGDKHYRSIWLADDGRAVDVIDQTLLPHRFEIRRLHSLEQSAEAIASMRVRGAPLIGATAAYGMAIAAAADPSDSALDSAAATLAATRPTAINLAWALERMLAVLLTAPLAERRDRAYAEAAHICDEDVDTCRRIGEHGLELFRSGTPRSGERFNVLTHCNAGWLATVDWGTALSPIYQAHDAGISVHVWVGETRPRNQGASLTAWELGQHGVPHTIVADSTGGHLMQHGQVDLCITGSDRTTATGDVANKIGTYLKALAARDNDVPFYVALPHSTIDWSLEDGLAEIPIEQRDPRELTRVAGRAASGELLEVEIAPAGSPAANYAFDVTPARLVTGLITERGRCAASREGLLSLYPERDETRMERERA